MILDAMSPHNTFDRMGTTARWFVAIALPAVILATVRPTGSFTSAASSEATALAVGQWLLVGLAGWLVITQVLYTIAIAARMNWAEQILRPLTLPLIRRLAAGATTAILTFSTAAPAALADPQPQVEVEIAEREGLRMEATPTPILEPITTPTNVATLPPEGSYSASLTWLVRPGDHLWKIAGEHLEIVMNRPPTDAEHARYWALLVDTARPIIRSGDPDLIYPGEQIPLPALLDVEIRP